MCYVSSKTGEGANEDTLTLQLAESLVYPEPPFRQNLGPLAPLNNSKKRKELNQKEIPFRISRKGNGEFNHKSE